MLTGLAFMAFSFAGYALSLWRGPFWGLLVYANLYFNVPDVAVNWWASYLPNLRWSYLTSAVFLVSCFLHRDKLSKHKSSIAYWLFIFYILSLLISHTIAVDPADAKRHTYMLLTFCIGAIFIIKAITKVDQLRLFFLVVIGLSANLSLTAYLYGKRIHERLEGIGPADATGSNEFGVLLAAVLPLMLPFLLRGRWYERVICILALPFIMNALILCNSRGAFVALAFGVFYAFLFVANKKVKKYIIIAGLCSFPVLLFLSDQYFIERISGLWKSDVDNQESLNKISSGRIAIWQHGIVMVNDHPFGAGPNGFKYLARFYMPQEMLSFHPGKAYGVRSAHNSYLQVLVEQGYLGLLIYLIICFYTIYFLRISAKDIEKMDKSGSFNHLLIIGLNMSFAVSMMGGMVGAQVYYEFFWWQIAFSVVTYSFVTHMPKNGSANSTV